jgi:predicted SAM-dependent methyltransferase
MSIKRRKLHLGCGPHALAGWENFDLQPHPGVMALDLSKELPFDTESVDFIFTEHFIEHLDYETGFYFLKQCYRVLHPDGVLRVSTPNLKTLIRDYEDKNVERYKGTWEPTTPCRMVNEGMRLWGHQFIYDWHELWVSLYNSGFRGITTGSRWHESNHAELRNLEVRPYRDDLIMEAEKAKK